MLRYKGLALPTVINSLNSILSLFYSIYFARQVESKVVLGQILALFLITSILMALTAPAAKVLLLSDDDRQKNLLILMMNMALSLIGGLSGYLFLFNSNSLIEGVSSIVVVLFIVCRLIYGGLNDYVLGKKKSKYIAIYSVLYIGFLYINLESGYYVGIDLLRLIVAFEFGRVLLFTTMMPLKQSSLRIHGFLNTSTIKEYFELLSFTVIANLKQHLDKGVVLIFLTTELYAEYQLGVISNPLIIILSLSFTTYSLPLLVKAFKEGKLEFYKVHVSLISKISRLTIPIIVFTIIWSSEIIRMFYGHDFSDAEKIFGIFSCSYLASHINVSNLFLVIDEKSKLSVLALINIIISTILLLILVPSFGVYGAVYSVALSVLLGYVYPFYVLRNKGISIVLLLNWLEQFGFFVLSLILAIFMRLLLRFDLIGDYTVIIWSVLYFVIFQAILFLNQKKHGFRLGRNIEI